MEAQRPDSGHSPQPGHRTADRARPQALPQRLASRYKMTNLNGEQQAEGQYTEEPQQCSPALQDLRGLRSELWSSSGCSRDQKPSPSRPESSPVSSQELHAWQRKCNLSTQRDLMGGPHCFWFQKRSPSIQAIGRRLELEPRNPDTHRFSPPGPTKLPLSGLGVSQRAYFPPRAGKRRRGWCVEWYLCYRHESSAFQVAQPQYLRERMGRAWHGCPAESQALHHSAPFRSHSSESQALTTSRREPASCPGKRTGASRALVQRSL